MPYRSAPLVPNEYYHIFNRGVAKMQIFNNFFDYNRFYKSMLYYQIEGPKPRYSLFMPETLKLDSTKKIVEIVSYCLMPNHFHFLVRQITEGGITEFISKLSNSYTKYYNIKHRRIGPLLQGDFKSVHIESNEQLIHLSRYVHLNPVVGYVTRDLETYRWSSYLEYVTTQEKNVCDKDVVLNQFQSKEGYREFVKDHLDYADRLEQLKHLLLDLEE